METKEKIYITTELNNDRAMTRSILKTAFGNKNKTIKNKKNTPFRDSVNDIKKTKANVIYSSSDYTKFKRLKSTNQKLIERIKAEEAACVTKEVTGGTFTTQEQLNTLNGCTKINGNITISGFNSTAPDFSVFSCLKEITGGFNIVNNGALTTISGFSSLTLPVEMQKALPLVPSLQSNWLMMHVSMMMISYATLIVGSLLSILYLAFVAFNKKEQQVTIEISQNEALYSANTSSKMALLQTVDIWSYRIIGLGFPFLTIGIISGAVWANEAWGSYWSWDPKETWALITWLVFAIYLHSRLLKGWQGEKAALLGSCGFFVIWICYLGVNFLGKGLHSYGWVL
jgi:cytochrome c-type biogenesis protein CcsB